MDPPSAPGLQIADIACADGESTMKIASQNLAYKVSGFDLSRKMIQSAKSLEI
jgi:2-polyprenyl-3-methyl-5-hydroxy-6-metoxy-1,4-benzoquinol methylase